MRSRARGRAALHAVYPAEGPCFDQTSSGPTTGTRMRRPKRPTKSKLHNVSARPSWREMMMEWSNEGITTPALPLLHGRWTLAGRLGHTKGLYLNCQLDSSLCWALVDTVSTISLVQQGVLPGTTRPLSPTWVPILHPGLCHHHQRDPPPDREGLIIPLCLYCSLHPAPNNPKQPSPKQNNNERDEGTERYNIVVRFAEEGVAKMNPLTLTELLSKQVGEIEFVRVLKMVI